MPREIIATDKAPKAIGPYSQAVAFEKLIFTAGQIALDPHTGELAAADIEGQVYKVLDNLKAVLEAAGSNMQRILKLTVFLLDLNDFAKLNAVFNEYFPTNPPARSAVQVSRLPRDVRVEIEAIAVREN